MSLLGIVYTVRGDGNGSSCGYCSPPGQRNVQASSFHDAEFVASHWECEVNDVVNTERAT